MKHRSHWLTAATVVIVLGLGCTAAASATDQPEQCNVRLALTLTPDVPDSQDPGFLGSILSSPTYQLTWISGTDTQATVLLTGPGPSSQCQNAVDKLGKDAHVIDIKVLEPGESA